MNHNYYLHPLPPHDSSSGSAPDGAGAGDAALARLMAQLEALGAQYERESSDRGLAQRVFNASAADLAPSRSVLARIGWQRYAGYAAAAALLGLAVLIPTGVLRFRSATPDRTISAAAFHPTELSPAGMSEQLMVGLFDGDAALESIDPSADDGIASLVVTHGHAADSVAVEVRQLLANGGGR